MDTKNIESFIQKNEIHRISDWIRNGYKTLDFSPLILDKEPTVSVQLKNIYLDFDSAIQNKFKLALNQAICEWTIDNDGAYVIEGLAIIAAYVRLTSSIDLLRSILESGRLKLAEKDEYENTTETIISVLSGFSPSEKIANIFKSLLFSDFDSQFSAQLFIGLCKCKPDNYTEFLPKFFSIVDQNSEFFDINSIMLDFRDIVSEYRISKYFKELDTKSQEKLLSFPIFSFLYFSKKELHLDNYIRLYEFRKNISKLKNQEEIIQYSLPFIRQELSAQFTAIYLISKMGYLCREGCDGVSITKDTIDNSWNPGEKYYIGQEFIGGAAKPDRDSKFGKSQFFDFTDKNSFFAKSDIPYSDLGTIYSGIAVPLDGANRTFGVISIINKIDKHGEVLIRSRFSDDDFYKFTEICNSLMNALFNLRIAQKNTFYQELAKFLVEETSKKNKAVYNQIVRDLVSPETTFRACILRIKDKSGTFKVVAKHSDNNNFKLREEDVIEHGIGIPGKTALKLEPSTFEINPDNINEFKNNADWVSENRFTSYCCLPLFSKGKAVGLISLYSGYYDESFRYVYDYISSIDFLKSISTLLAIFIQNTDTDKVLNQAIESIDSVLKDQLKLVRKHLAETSFDPKVFKEIDRRLESAQNTLGTTNQSMKSFALYNDLRQENVSSIYVGNLSYEVTQEDLTSVFAEYGSVKRVQLPTDRETGRMRGFGFVEMGSDAEEEKAIEELDGAQWMGRNLKVNKAKPREVNRGRGSRRVHKWD